MDYNYIQDTEIDARENIDEYFRCLIEEYDKLSEIDTFNIDRKFEIINDIWHMMDKVDKYLTILRLRMTRMSGLAYSELRKIEKKDNN